MIKIINLSLIIKNILTKIKKSGIFISSRLASKNEMIMYIFSFYRGIHMKNFTKVSLTKIISIASKILEITYWVIAAVFLMTVIVCIVSPSTVAEVGGTDYYSEVTLSSFSMEITNSDGSINPSALAVFSVTTFLTTCIGALVLRNVYLIIKKATSKKVFEPFSNDISKMVRKIGIFYIVIFFIESFAVIAGKGIIGDDAAISLSFSNLMTGVVVICLSQVFTYGKDLQTDVDGLI